MHMAPFLPPPSPLSLMATTPLRPHQHPPMAPHGYRATYKEEGATIEGVDIHNGGERLRCVKRKSLPDIYEEKLVLSFVTDIACRLRQVM